MILNARGQLVWYDPLKGNLAALNLEVQRYKRRPVLTWFRGTAEDGEDVIMDSSYRTVAIVRAGNGYFADAHKVQIRRAAPRGLTPMYRCAQTCAAWAVRQTGPWWMA